MPLYILRHKPTNSLMPIRRTGRGYTYWDPTTKSSKEVEAPRVFSNKTAAINAARWWEQGKWYYSHDWETGEADLNRSEVEGRKGTLEIVEVKLVEVG